MESSGAVELPRGLQGLEEDRGEAEDEIGWRRGHVSSPGSNRSSHSGSPSWVVRGPNPTGPLASERG